jgi:hypothetical protein
MIDFRLKLKKNYWHNLGKIIALSQNNELIDIITNKIW